MLDALFKQLKIAIFKPQDYYILARVRAVNSFLYTVLLAFLGSFVMLFYVASYFHIGTLTDWIHYNSPDYVYTDGRLIAQDKYYNNIDGLGIYLDTQIDMISVEEMESFIMENDLDVAIALNATGFVIGVSNSRKAPLPFYYRSFGMENFTKFDVNEKMDIAKTLSATIFILFAMLFILLFYYASALGYFIVGLLISIIFKTKCEYGDLFQVCMYGKTLMFIIWNIMLWVPGTPINTIWFHAISIIVTMVYIVIGIERLDKFYPKPVRFAR